VAEEKEADFQGQGRVAVPGACGELVQGTLDGEQPFLISCPIDRFSVAEVELTSERRGWSCPPDTPKSVTALQAMLARLGHTEMGGQLRIRSDLPRAKGMASSTADIAATVYALAEALGEGVEPWEVARIALSVEPSDSLMFPGLALFDHRSGQVYEDLGPAPPLEVVVLDFGGTVDTLAYNRRYRADLLRKMVAEHREALAAGPAIARHAVELIEGGAESLIADLVNGDLSKVTAKEVNEAAQRGDRVAAEVFRRAGFYIGVGIVNLLYLFNPSMIIIGGSVAKAGDLLFEPIWETVNSRISEIYRHELSIVPAALGDDVGLMGALALVLWQEEMRR